jgi:hypothetical protein
MTYTIEDIDNLTRLLRMDLSQAQAKLTDLKRMLASFDLPSKPDDPTARIHLAEVFIRNGGYELVDQSLLAELVDRGIPEPQHQPLLELARSLRP